MRTRKQIRSRYSRDHAVKPIFTNRIQESKNSAIELKDDNPDALWAMLRYIYTDDYVPTTKIAPEWLFHLNVSSTAKKYLVSALDQKAFEEFKRLIGELTDVEDIFKALQILSDYGDHREDVEEVRLELREKHILSLLKLPAFRDILSEDKELMWKYLDHFSNIVQKHLLRCAYCGRIELRNVDLGSPRCTCYDGRFQSMQVIGQPYCMNK